MIIEKLRARFGVLNDSELSLTEGLNVIKLPNESGKSTWCAFVRAMLYGIESSERASKGNIPDKKRYMPWSGLAMEGSMELKSGDERIRLIRRTKTATAPMREFEAHYTDTGEPLKGVTGKDAGEYFTGVPREVFVRSAYIGQGAVQMSGSAELERRISALVSSGEEELTYSETDKNLRAMQRQLRYNRSGLIPETESKVEGIERAARERSGKTAQLEQARVELGEYERRYEQWKKTDMLDRERMAQETKAAEQEQDEHEKKLQTMLYESKAELSTVQRQKEAHALGGMSEKEAQSTSERDLVNLSRLESEDYSGSFKQTYWILGMLAAVFLVLAAVFYSPYRLMCLASGIILIILDVLYIVRDKSHGKQRHDRENREKISEILARYSVREPQDIERSVREYAALCEGAAALRERVGQLESSLVHLTSARELSDKAREAVTDSGRGEREAAEQLHRSRIVRQREQIARMEGELGADFDVEREAEEKESLYSKLSVYLKQEQALKLAREALEQADREMQRRFSPALSRRAGELFERMCGGRYKAVQLDNEMSATVLPEGSAVMWDYKYLSAGATDLLYLAVRLAICEALMPKDKNFPLILDDVLVNLDSERRASALKLLEELAQERQILLFCTD